MVKFTAIVASIAALPLLASAYPSYTPRNMILPRNTYKMARDDVTKRIIAFDKEGRELGVFPIHAALNRRGAGPCTNMNNDDLKKVPGLQKMRDEADKEWGKGKRNEVLNDKDFPESPANVCAEEDAVLLAYDGKPDCKDTTNKADGSLEDGKIILENQNGIKMDATTTTTRTSGYSISTKIGASFKFPEIADVSTEITTTGEFSNSKTDSTTLTSDTRTVQRIEQPVSDGAKCDIQLITKTCSVQGKGTMNMLATGVMWFEFEDKVDGHFKWALTFEGVLSKEERNSPIELKTSGTISSFGKFNANGCETKNSTSSSAAPAASKA